MLGKDLNDKLFMNGDIPLIFNIDQLPLREKAKITDVIKYSNQCIYECVRQDKIIGMENYRIRPHIIDEGAKLMSSNETLTIDKRNRKAERPISAYEMKLRNRGEKMESNNDKVQIIPKKVRQTSKPIKLRMYTEAEDNNIVDLIVEYYQQGGTFSLAGDNLYRRLAPKFTGRTWQSVKERIKKKLHSRVQRAVRLLKDETSKESIPQSPEPTVIGPKTKKRKSEKVHEPSSAEREGISTKRHEKEGPNKPITTVVALNSAILDDTIGASGMTTRRKSQRKVLKSQPNRTPPNKRVSRSTTNGEHTPRKSSQSVTNTSTQCVGLNNDRDALVNDDKVKRFIDTVCDIYEVNRSTVIEGLYWSSGNVDACESYLSTGLDK
eukprot:Ihof_evm2s587 gene=Ihof_evmTU2s587